MEESRAEVIEESRWLKEEVRIMDIRTQAALVGQSFVTEWGAVRRFIAAHPLTGAWGFMIVGVLAGWLMGKLL